MKLFLQASIDEAAVRVHVATMNDPQGCEHFAAINPCKTRSDAAGAFQCDNTLMLMIIREPWYPHHSYTVGCGLRLRRRILIATGAARAQLLDAATCIRPFH